MFLKKISWVFLAFLCALTVLGTGKSELVYGQTGSKEESAAGPAGPLLVPVVTSPSLQIAGKITRENDASPIDGIALDFSLGGKEKDSPDLQTNSTGAFYAYKVSAGGYDTEQKVNYQTDTIQIDPNILNKAIIVRIEPQAQTSNYYLDTNKNGQFDEKEDNILTLDPADINFFKSAKSFQGQNVISLDLALSQTSQNKYIVPVDELLTKTDKDGKITPEIQTDANGKEILDQFGQPQYKYAPVPNAKVDLIDFGCDLQIEQVANDKGLAIFQKTDFKQYLEKINSKTCVPRLQIKVTAKGYYSRVAMLGLAGEIEGLSSDGDYTLYPSMKLTKMADSDRQKLDSCSAEAQKANQGLVAKVKELFLKNGTSSCSLVMGFIYNQRDGQPIENASMNLIPQPAQTQTFSATSDKTGIARIDNLASGQYIFNVYHPDYTQQENYGQGGNLATKTNMIFKLEESEIIFINASLYPLPDQDSVKLTVSTLDENTGVAPVALQQVLQITIDKGSPNEKKIIPDWTGKTDVYFKKGENAEIEIVQISKFDENHELKPVDPVARYIKEIKIPSGISLSAIEIENYNKALTFPIDLCWYMSENDCHSGSAKITVAVTNEKDQAVEGADVVVFDGNLYESKKTDQEGQTNFDRLYFNATSDVIQDIGTNNLDALTNQGASSDLKLGEKYYFYARKENVGKAKEEITLSKPEEKVSLQLLNSGSFYLNFINTASEKISFPKSTLAYWEITLERSQAEFGKFEKVDASISTDKYPDYLGFSIAGEQAGYYRAKIPAELAKWGPQYSDTVYYDGKKDVDSDYYFCKGDDSAYAPISWNAAEGVSYIAWDGKSADFISANKTELAELASRIKTNLFGLYFIKPLTINITDDGSMNAVAETDPEFQDGYNQCAQSRGLNIGNPLPVLIDLSYIEMTNRNEGKDSLYAIIGHEYGHHIYQNLEDQAKLASNKDKANIDLAKKWADLYREITASSFSQCVWDRIKDSNIEHDVTNYGGHPYDDPTEMFASFFSAYATNHSYLQGVITNETEGDCQNTLKYMWQLVAENIGEVSPQDGKVFLPLGDKIGNTQYSFDQIRSGDWLLSNYNDLSLPEKVNTYYTWKIQPALNNLI